jgi:hypothetical protein
MKSAVPTCGQSDQRNQEYTEQYSPEKYFRCLVSEDNPVIFDIGAHRGESVKFFKEIFARSTIYSFEPDIENYNALTDVCESARSLGGGAVIR